MERGGGGHDGAGSGDLEASILANWEREKAEEGPVPSGDAGNHIFMTQPSPRLIRMGCAVCREPRMDAQCVLCPMSAQGDAGASAGVEVAAGDEGHRTGSSKTLASVLLAAARSTRDTPAGARPGGSGMPLHARADLHLDISCFAMLTMN